MQVQTIGFISHLREKAVNGPFLVVGPLSTLSNWVDEFKRWLPSCPVVLYHGSKDERQKLRNRLMPTGMLTTVLLRKQCCPLGADVQLAMLGSCCYSMANDSVHMVMLLDKQI